MIFLSSRKGNGKQGGAAPIINDSFFRADRLGTLDRADFVSFDHDKEEFSKTLEEGGTLGPDDPDDNPGNSKDGVGFEASEEDNPDDEELDDNAYDHFTWVL